VRTTTNQEISAIITGKTQQPNQPQNGEENGWSRRDQQFSDYTPERQWRSMKRPQSFLYKIIKL